MKLSLFYDHVTILDYAYLDTELGPVGDSLVVNVEFVGRTDSEGVIYDFSYAKKKVKEIIDRDCDHRLVVPRGATERKDELVILNYEFKSGGSIHYRAPEQSICEIPFEQITLENLTKYLEEIVLNEMPDTVEKVNLTLLEEEKSNNHIYFRYTHGLREHYGNCQRLLHGHRSTFKLYFDGKRDFEKEVAWVKEHLTDTIHFAYWENVTNQTEILAALDGRRPVGRYEDLPNIELKYSSNQGEFELSISSSLVYLIAIETTVENLSTHFCQEIKGDYQGKGDVSVHAFEGIGKGAITTL